MADIKVVFEADTAPIDRAVRLMDKLEAELRDVDRAMKTGLITGDQYAAETERLNKNIQRLNIAAKGSSKDFRVFEKSMYNSGKATRRTEIAMQQAGYQVQDFIVQVQAGTNPLIAFSQQGSQLAGFFAGPWGAAIGLGIAAVGFLGTALLGLGEKADKVKGQMEDLNKTLSSYGDLSSQISDSKALSEEFGNLASQARSMLEALKEIQGITLSKQISEFGGLGQIIRSSSYEIDKSGFLGLGVKKVSKLDSSQIDAAAEFLGVSEKSLAESSRYAGQYLKLLEGLQKAVGLKEQAAAAGELSKFLKEHVNSYELSEEATNAISAMQERLLQITKLQGQEQQKGAAKLQQIQTDAMAMEAEIAEERRDEENKAAELYLIKRRYVLDTIAAAEKKQAEDTLAYEGRVNKTRLQMAKMQEERRKKAVIDSQNEIERNFKFSQNARLMISRAYNNEQIKSNQQVYSDLVDSQNKYMAELQEALKTGADLSELNLESPFKTALEAAKLLSHEMDMALEDALTLINAASKPTGSVGRGKTLPTAADLSAMRHGGVYIDYDNKPKGGKQTTIEDTIKQLKRQADKETKLVTLTGQKRREEELFIDLKNANADADVKTSEKRLASVAQEISAMEERNRVIEEGMRLQQEIADYIGSSIEDALMSMVDGTKSVKDAFRDMARDIIAELYRVLVVQKMVNSAKALFGFADGGVFQGGSQVKAFANGGVVGSPTLFPMSGGKTGLMGEAGPEAIMPLKRGPNGKLGVQVQGGTGDTINVNQTINVSTGVQQTVRTEIKSLMPQIAESAKAAVANAKRRGGSYGRSF